tara:strand:- start:2541 stop:3275 length:735 start_codon:yes stop_codon:yes gene_type:complete
MDYLGLVTSIQDYCQNSETSFKNNINNFIIAAEDRVFTAFEVPAFWKSDAATVIEADKSEYTLPVGVLDVLSVRVGENSSIEVQPVEFGPVRYLLQKDYDFLLEAYPGTNSVATGGIPKYYAVSTAGVTTSNPTLTIRLGPIPDEVYPMTTTYYGKTAGDSITSGATPSAPTTTETWLSVTFPDALLYGSIVQAYIYMKGEPDLINMYEKQLSDCLVLLKNVTGTRGDNDDYRPSPSPLVQQAS